MGINGETPKILMHGSIWSARLVLLAVSLRKSAEIMPNTTLLTRLNAFGACLGDLICKTALRVSSYFCPLILRPAHA